MNTNQRRPNTAVYMIETIAGVALFYFLLGGSSASLMALAVFSIFAVWVVLMNVLHDAGLQTDERYSRWKLQIALLLVVVVFAAGLWTGSWSLVGIGLLLAVFWRGDLHAHRTLYEKVRRLQGG